MPSHFGASFCSSWSNTCGCVNIYPMQEPFIEPTPTRESRWRAIVMMGQNSATYKFALAASLIELSSTGSELVLLEKLAAPFSRHLREDAKHSGKQSTRKTVRPLIGACNQSNNGELTDKSLIETRAKLGFVNVIDAFHVANQGDTPVRFFNDDRKT